MALSITVKLTGDVGRVQRTQAALRNPRPLMKRIGVLFQSSANRRLTQVLRQDGDTIRTGRLMAAIPAGDPNTGTPGRMTGDSIFDLSEASVTIGVNLPYAAQVHFGGTIVPKDAKALAIPVVDALKRDRIGPSELDPDRSILKFVPVKGGKPNIIGVLVDEPQLLTGRQRKPRGKTAYGPGILYVLASSVTQPPRPFLLIDDDDQRIIRDELIPAWINGR